MAPKLVKIPPQFRVGSVVNIVVESLCSGYKSVGDSSELTGDYDNRIVEHHLLLGHQLRDPVVHPVTH